MAAFCLRKPEIDLFCILPCKFGRLRRFFIPVFMMDAQPIELYNSVSILANQVVGVEILFFEVKDRREMERERKRGRKEKGKGKLEVKLWQKRKQIANAPAGNRTRDPGKKRG